MESSEEAGRGGAAAHHEDGPRRRSRLRPRHGHSVETGAADLEEATTVFDTFCSVGLPVLSKDVTKIGSSLGRATALAVPLAIVALSQARDVALLRQPPERVGALARVELLETVAARLRDDLRVVLPPGRAGAVPELARLRVPRELDVHDVGEVVHRLGVDAEARAVLERDKDLVPAKTREVTAQRRVAAAPRPRRGRSVATGSGSRRRRGHDVDIP